WLTPKSGGKVDYERPTQVGRAMKELGVHMIPAYSPQARGRSERNFSTWQGRLPQELRLRGIRTLEAAEQFHQDGEADSGAKHLRGVSVSELMGNDASRESEGVADLTQVIAELNQDSLAILLPGRA